MEGKLEIEVRPCCEFSLVLGLEFIIFLNSQKEYH